MSRPFTVQSGTDGTHPYKGVPDVPPHRGSREPEHPPSFNLSCDQQFGVQHSLKRSIEGLALSIGQLVGMLVGIGFFCDGRVIPPFRVRCPSPNGRE
jgi:hypothetical protein